MRCVESGGPLVITQSMSWRAITRRAARSANGAQLRTYASGTSTRVSSAGAVVAVGAAPGRASAGRRSMRRSDGDVTRSAARTTPRSPSSASAPLLALVRTHGSCPAARKWRTIAAQRCAPAAVEGGK